MLSLFVNVHPHELDEGWLVRPDDPLFFHERAVYLEITESAAFSYFSLCVNVLKEICSRSGAFLVVDDFGAGHSNLKRIIDLEPHIVKLDLALVRGIEKSKRQQILVRQVVSLCKELGARVVAEGIETGRRALGGDRHRSALRARLLVCAPGVSDPEAKLANATQNHWRVRLSRPKLAALRQRASSPM